MPPPPRAGALSLRPMPGRWAAMTLAIGVVACGRGAPRPAVVPAPPSSSVTRAPAPSAPLPLPPPSTAATGMATAAPLLPAPAPTSAVAGVSGDPSWAVCHRGYKASGQDLVNDVAAMAKGCAALTRMKLVGATRTGKQAAEDAPQSFPFEAKASHCYRVYAQAAEGIEDLDVAVKDSASIVVGQDSTSDGSPVVLEDGEVCFHQDDKATVVVSVGMGKGSYAFQIWGD